MLKKIEDYIKNFIPNFQNVRILDSNEYPKYGANNFCFVAEGETYIEGQFVTIQIALDDNFPLSKPFFFLNPHDALGFIPHIDSKGFICYAHDEGLLIDKKSITGIIEEAIERAFKTLKDGISGANSEDIQTEFASYWDCLENMSLIESNVELTDRVKHIKIVKFENYKLYFAGDECSTIMNYCYKYLGEHLMGKPVFSDALYIPLREGTEIKPPYYGTFWSTNEFRNLILKNVTSSNKRAIEKIAKKRLKQGDILVVLISIPLANGNRAVIGVQYSKFSMKGKSNITNRFSHPLKKTDYNCSFIPLSVERHDKGFILPRGGGHNSLNDKKIALIGCGSVGGYIATELAKAGIQNISLIDKDELNQENVYRHALGVNSIKYEAFKNNNKDRLILNAYKTYQLKKEIQNKLPYTKIEAPLKYIDKIENIIKKGDIDFKQFNLVISALGNPTVELYIDECFHKELDMPPIIFTWLEPYGIGGHAILTNNNKKNGCLKCLYTDPFDKDTPLYNKASFAKEGQFFAKQVTGCGSVFMPYGSLDSVQTAIIATRLAIDVLTGKEKDNPIISWKGNADMFLENGFKLSEHYSLTTEELFNIRYLYKNDSCEICSGLEEKQNV